MDITAAYRVLLTVELAEIVLSNLPFQNLVSAELVCRTWASLIPRSRRTRQGLFLEPIAPGQAGSLAYQSSARIRRPWQIANRSMNIKRYTETYTIALLHPYLQSLAPELEGRGRIAFTFDWQKALALKPEGRWREMFVTQPPCRNVKIEFLILGQSVQFTGRDRISDSAGVRLGHVVNRVKELLARPARSGEWQQVPVETQTQVLRRLGVQCNRDEPDDFVFERLECFVEGYIREEAAFALASKAAAAAAAAVTGDGMYVVEPPARRYVGPEVTDLDIRIS